jgi:hypothetical protein
MSMDPQEKRPKRFKRGSNERSQAGSPARRPESSQNLPLRVAMDRQLAKSATQSLFPDYIPDDLVTDPKKAAVREVIPKNPNARNSHKGRNKLIALAVTGVMGAGAYGIYSAIEDGTEHAIEKLFPDKTDTTSQIGDAPGSGISNDPMHYLPGDTNHDGAYSNDELKAMSPADVANISPSLLLPVYGPELDSWRQDTYNNVIRAGRFTADQLSNVTVPTGEKAAYSDQDILNQVALDVIDASTQDDTVDGERILALPYDKGLGGFTQTVKQIDTNQNSNPTKMPVINSFKELGEPLPRPKSSFNGLDLSDYTQVRLIQQEALPNNPQDPEFTEYGLYGLVANGNSEEWRELRRWTVDDYNFSEALSALKATPVQH